nr:MAG TPA: hypothetical protein [Caudoviricetes sp.]
MEIQFSDDLFSLERLLNLIRPNRGRLKIRQQILTGA